LDDEIEEIKSVADEIVQSNGEAEGESEPQEEGVNDVAKDQVGTSMPKEHTQNQANEQETTEESKSMDTEVQEQTTATAAYTIMEQVTHDATSFT
jgi:hypothetical protein